MVDEDNEVRAAARREAPAKAKHSILTPLVIRAIREACGLSQRDAALVFGGGPKAFEKYEAGEVAPSAAIAVARGEAAGVVSERLGRTDDGGGRCRYDPADGAGEFDRGDRKSVV